MHEAYCNFQLVMSKFEFNVYEKAVDIMADVENLTKLLKKLKAKLNPNEEE